jgi:hypothetical protein
MSSLQTCTVWRQHRASPQGHRAFRYLGPLRYRAGKGCYVCDPEHPYRLRIEATT